MAKHKHSISERSNILEEIYLKTLEALPDAVLITDDSGKIVVFNKEAELLFGYHRSETIGEKVEKLIPEDLRVIHVSERTKYTEKPILKEMGGGRLLHGLHRTGRLIPVDIRLSPMVIANAGVHILAVIRAIDKPPKLIQIKKDLELLKEEL